LVVARLSVIGQNMRKSEITYYLLQHFLRLRFFLFIGLINFAFLICHGQDYENGYAIKHYTIEDGLPSNTVYGVTSDRDGFLWFCTDAGVAKYDGITFKTFTTKDGLPSNEVFELFCDSKNRIWMSSFYNGVAYIMNDKVHTSDNDSVLNKVKNPLPIPKYFEDSKGCIYFRTKDYAYFKISLGNNLIYFGKPRSDIMLMFEINNKIFDIGSYLSILDYNNSYVSVDSPKDKTRISGIAQDGEDIYFVTGDNRIQKTSLNVLYSGAIVGSNFRWELPLINRQFWVKGFKGINISSLSNPQKTISILNSKIISYINQDSFGHIWSCTLSEGVYRVNSSANKVLNMKESVAISAIAIDKNQLFLGTKTNDLYSMNKQDLSLNFSLKNASQNTLNGINSILFDHKKIYYSDNNGVYCASINGEYFSQVTNGAKRIYLAEYIIELDAGGISCFNKSNNKFIKSIDKPKRFYSYASYNNQMIFGTQDSLYYLKDKQFYPYQLNIPFDYRANDLIVKDSLLIATTIEKGIFFIHNHKVLKNINSSNGINTNTCYRSYIYKNKLYTASKKGIHVYDFATEKITHVYESDGLPSNTVFDLAIENDTLYAATEKGLCILPISSIKQNRTFPFFIKPIYKANDTTWDLPPIIQTHTDTSLTFVLNALNFNVKGGVTYYYRIKEIDTSYTHSIDKNVTIKIEKPGEYIFEAFALNTEGTKSNVKILHVCVEPYFYQTIWFKVLVFSVIIAFIILLVYYFVQRAKKKQIEKAELDAKIRNLELSAWKSAINPHFLFNSLNTMQGLFHLNDFKKANSYVTEFSGILRKTIDHSGRLLIKLDDEVKYLNNYLELEKIKRSDSFTYDVKYDSPKLLQYYIPSLLIQPVIENSIKHAIRDGINGYIKINFALQNNTVECVISDNGGGFPKEAVQKDYVSKGLRLIKSKINIVERLTNSSIHFSYKNRYNNSNEIVGAETTFYFPLLTIDYDSGLMD
jgi:hypothetical protein